MVKPIVKQFWEYSQLLQSSVSGYEFISQLVDNESFDIIEYLLNKYHIS